MKKNFGLLFGSVLAAVAASSCCILPLLLGAASVGTVGLGAALTPYRPYLMALTALLLGTAFYFTYRPGKATPCGPDGSCSTESVAGGAKQRMSRGVLWVVTLFTVTALAYPEVAARRAAASGPREVASNAGAALPKSSQTITFAVGDMSCADCTVSIVTALKATPGVYDAAVNFETKRAIINYDPTQVEQGALKAAIEKTGYSATDVAKAPGPSDAS